MHINCSRSNHWTAELTYETTTYRSSAKTRDEAIAALFYQVAAPFEERNRRTNLAKEVALAEWDAAFGEFSSSVRQNWHDERAGGIRSRSTLVGLTLECPECGDSRSLKVGSTGFGSQMERRIDDLCKELFQIHYPQPANAKLLPSSPSELAEGDLEVEKHRDWTFHVTDPAGVTTQLPEPWSGGPTQVMEGLTPVINRYAADGWRVASIQEDKAMYNGHDASREPMPVRVRVLLEADSPTGD